MPLVFITGAAGSGKTVVCQELKRIGKLAYDTDEDGLARWRNISNGYTYPKSSIKKADRTKEFLKNHRWVVPKDFLNEIQNKYPNQTVYICGAISNFEELRNMFQKVISLKVSKELIEQRLITRPGDNCWGKQEHEREATMKKYDSDYANDVENGYEIVSSDIPVNELARSLVKLIEV